MASEDEAKATAVVAEVEEGKNWWRKGKHDKPQAVGQESQHRLLEDREVRPHLKEGGMLEVNSFSPPSFYDINASIFS
jgi:ribosomal RNA assembly protein